LLHVTMSSISSKVIFGIGVALAVAAISSIFVTAIATQNQSSQQSSSSLQSSSNSGGASEGGQTSTSGATQQQGSNSGDSSNSNTGGGGNTNTITIPQGAATQQVQQYYQPDPAQIQSGSQVTWQNKDSAPHTATADDGSFDTGNIAPGESGSAIVQGQGQISYSCTIHPFMKGIVQVSASSSSSSPSQQGNSQQQQSGNGTSPQSNSSQQHSNQLQQQQSSQSGSNQQSAQQNSPQQGTQTSIALQGSSTQPSGSITQILQQAGQGLIQAANALQQIAGGGNSGDIMTSTPSQQSSGRQYQPSGQSPMNNSSLQASQSVGSQSQTAQSQSSSNQQQESSPPQQQTSPQQGSVMQSTNSSSQQQGAAAGAGNSGGGGTTNQITIPQGAQSGTNGYYDPANAQVAPGSKVTWVNKDSVAHTATAQDSSFDTGNIAPGESGSAIVQGQGQISYSCTIHPWMVASLTVGGQGGAGNIQQASSNSGGQRQQQPQQSQGGGASQQQQQAGGGGGQTSAEGFPIRTQATAFAILPKSNDTETGLEPSHKDDWVTANHDIYYSRNSQQTTIGKDNVSKLQAKWILNTDFPIENPPLIVGDRGYAQDNAMRVIAFDVNTGLNVWKFDPGVADKQSQQLPRGVFSHGITYDDGVIFAPTGANGTIVALNATSGKLIWQTASIGDPRLGYRLPMPPIVWKDYVIAGSALGDEPPFSPAAKGSITAFNRTNGEKLWNISTVVGDWIEGEKAKINGGGTVWSGGSLDPETGIFYVPVGNAAPDFNATSRPPPNKYTSSIIAIDIRNGQILWDTPSVTHDTHDWDTAWGTSLAKVKVDGGNTMMNIVIAQNKRGEGFALNANDGKVLWNDTLGVQFRTDAPPTPYGSGTVWPGSNHGVEAYNANDNATAYYAVSNMGFNYFQDSQGGSGHLQPVFDAIDNGIGNGTIVAVDIKTGKVKWEYPTEFPTWVSPAVTNGVVFSGHITATGKPYPVNNFGAPTETPQIPSGVIMALDKDTGNKLWEFNVGAPIGIGGPSIGHGMLFVTTGSPAEVESNKGGYIVAFGLPSNDTGNNVSEKAGANLTNDNSSTNMTTLVPAANSSTSSNATVSIKSDNSSQGVLDSSTTAATNNNASVVAGRQNSTGNSTNKLSDASTNKTQPRQ
jgi:alcohol dehydrogenase (cytochrome c)